MPNIDDPTWNRQIQGRQLRGATLGEEIGHDVVLLVFLRHLG